MNIIVVNIEASNDVNFPWLPRASPVQPSRGNLFAQSFNSSLLLASPYQTSLRVFAGCSLDKGTHIATQPSENAPTTTMAIQPLGPLANPLVTSIQLLHFKSASNPSTPSSHFATFLLTQAAGILLRLPQETIATAIVLLQRYLISTASNAPGSTPPPTPTLLSSTSLYLASKLSSLPTSPRSLINVYALLTSPTSSPLPFINHNAPPPSSSKPSPAPDPHGHYISEGSLATHRLALFTQESHLLTSLAFSTHVALPHPLALTYLSALGFTPSHPATARLSRRVLAHLNAALLSPQYLYLTHQPNVLAVGAIYLAAREEGIRVVGGVDWWEVFDVGREELGFVVVALSSMEGFVQDEAEKWAAATDREGEGAEEGVGLGLGRVQ